MSLDAYCKQITQGVLSAESGTHKFQSTGAILTHLLKPDLILMSESATGLQNCLHRLDDYCNKWQLVVNINKAKIMIFGKSGRVGKKLKFFFNSQVLD